MPPPWKQVVPVIGLFGLYGAWVLRDRSVMVGKGWMNCFLCFVTRRTGGRRAGVRRG